MKRFTTNPLEDEILSDILDHWTDTISGDRTTDAVGNAPQSLHLEMDATAPDIGPVTPIQPEEPAQEVITDDTQESADHFDPTFASEDVAPVQPLPLGPVYAQASTSDEATTQQFATSQTQAKTGTFEATPAASSWDSLQHAQDYVLDVVDELVNPSEPGNNGSGPTISVHGGGGDYEVAASGTVLNKPLFSNLTLVSKGIYSAGFKKTNIDVNDMLDWQLGPFQNVYHAYSAVDASAATGLVEYHGFDFDRFIEAHGKKGPWDPTNAPTRPDVKQLMDGFQNVFKGGDHGNIVHGGEYSDILIGGEGDDFIITGTGDNIVELVGGDNWVLAGQNAIEDGEIITYSNRITAGSGTDTFVIGNIPEPETQVFVSGGLDFDEHLKNCSLDLIQNVISEGAGMTGIPFAGALTDFAFDFFRGLFGDSPSETIVTTEWPDFQCTYIYDFNPLTDRLLLPVDPRGDFNYEVMLGSSGSSDYDIRVYDEATKSTILRIEFADADAIFSPYTGISYNQSLGSEEAKGFQESFLYSTFALDKGGFDYGNGNLTPPKGYDLEDLKNEMGETGFLFGGSWTGRFLDGVLDSRYYMGSAHDDVLFGYSITGTDPNPNNGGGKVFYGFEGDNLFGTGNGTNTVYGGIGDSTITYQFGTMAIYADLSDRNDYGAEGYGKAYKIYQGAWDTDAHVDTVYQVENIIGSIFDDVLIGHKKEDNTFYSTGSTDGGENTWTGTGGSNEYHFNGGTTRITDYTESDTLIVHKSEYTGSNYLRWTETELEWILVDRENQQIVSCLNKTVAFDAPAEIELYREDGTSKTYTPKTKALDSFDFDLFL